MSQGTAFAPTADPARVTDPLARAARITQIAKQRGTLTSDEARVRKEDLNHARWNLKRKLNAIAARVGLSAVRVYQLTRRPALPQEAAS